MMKIQSILISTLKVKYYEYQVMVDNSLLSRLGLERCSTSKEALDTITELLDKHGQCGLTSQDHSFGQWSYNTSFIFVDPKEAWLLETAGEFWAAKHISGMYQSMFSFDL